jgi:hypothetical protein
MSHAGLPGCPAQSAIPHSAVSSAIRGFVGLAVDDGRLADSIWGQLPTLELVTVLAA